MDIIHSSNLEAVPSKIRGSGTMMTFLVSGTVVVAVAVVSVSMVVGYELSSF